MRSQDWLDKQLEYVWSRHFPDVPEYNPVRIEFGRRARTRLGSISIDPKQAHVSRIRITGWFRYEEIPESIVHSVIVHEMCHYAHGFNSHAKQRHKHPHAGGVIRKEFADRGLEHLYDYQQQWLKKQWPRFIKKHHNSTTGSSTRSRGSRIKLSIFG